MTDIELTTDELAEIIRKRQKYRDLILSGKITLPHDKAARLLGPDCLYQLYGSPERSPRRRRKTKASLTHRKK